MPKFHFVLQGKGGVGKTTCASLIAQFLQSKGIEKVCYDTDPINASFFSYDDLDVKTINIMQGGRMNSRAWDALIEDLGSESRDVVIDNGATSFSSLFEYISNNRSLEILKNYGTNVQNYIHIPIAGGEGLGHTLSGMRQIVEQLHDQDPIFVLWLKPFLGPIERDGETLESFEEYLDCKSKIYAIIDMPELTPPETFARDFQYILSKNLTFEKALQMKIEETPDGDTVKKSVNGFEIAVMQRLSIIQSRIFEMLDASGVFYD